MKIIKYLLLLTIVAFTVSCEKHEIEYMTTDVVDKAEFQLHYMVPVSAVSANYLYRVEINNQLYANNKAPLTTYNAIPNGSVGRFYTVNPGTVNIKLYQGTDETLVYDQDIALTKGKQNIFIHDFNQAPIIFDNGYPYSTNVTLDSDSTCWVKFYNFLYETAGVPTDLKLQYQYIDSRTDEPINIGEPVAFGETTGWYPIKVIKSLYNSSGYQKIYYRIKVIDNAGNATGELQVMKSNGTFVDYSDYWNGYIGRRYHHILRGMRAAVPTAAVSQFTAL